MESSLLENRTFIQVSSLSDEVFIEWLVDISFLLTSKINSLKNESKLLLLSDTLSKDLKLLSLPPIVNYLAVKPQSYAKELLGETKYNLFFDARDGVSLDYLLASLNAIGSGGWVWFIEPPWQTVTKASARFQPNPIKTPNFDSFFLQGLMQYSSSSLELKDLVEKTHLYKRLIAQFVDHLLSKQTLNNERKESKQANNTPSPSRVKLTTEQAYIVKKFNEMENGVATLFSSRGSGKSVVGNQLISINPLNYILTAPNQKAISRYDDYRRVLSVKQKLFYAPDRLLGNFEPIDYSKTLIIEEAAKLPLNKLIALCTLFPKVLLISSVDNYEGTNQGLVTKFNEALPPHKKIARYFSLTKNMRFNSEDPIAKFCDYLDLSDKTLISSPLSSFPSLSSLSDSQGNCWQGLQVYEGVQLTALRQKLKKIADIYHLLKKTHYQTSIQDIRRLFDDPEMVLVCYGEKGRLLGVVWAVKEGGLKEALAVDVYRGLRRPKGNLVAQMLGLYGYSTEPMLWVSFRITRISVEKDARLQGIARKMIKQLLDSCQEGHFSNIGKIDFLSASFGLTRPLLTFWEKCGFTWLHLGTHQDKTTALYAAVVIAPLSARAKIWQKEQCLKWQADAYEYYQGQKMPANLSRMLQEIGKIGGFDKKDKEVLKAIEAYQKPKRSFYGVYQRQKRHKEGTVFKNQLVWLKNAHYQTELTPGVTVNIDGPERIGGQELGSHPLELFLASLSSCLAMSLVHLLKEDHIYLSQLSIETIAIRTKERPQRLEEVKFNFIIEGELTREKPYLNLLIDKALNHYCSLALLLKDRVIFTYEITIR